MKSAGAGAKCDHFKLGVRTRVRAYLNLDVRGACVRPKKGSQLPPWPFFSYFFLRLPLIAISLQVIGNLDLMEMEHILLALKLKPLKLCKIMDPSICTVLLVRFAFYYLKN